MRSIARDLAILALVGGVVLFSNLGGPRLWDRDEPRNAGCALEMRERGDWITPWFNDELRSHKPVINKAYRVEELLGAVRRYVDRTHRRVTFEYALMRGINDSPELAHELASKLQGILCHVNLIPLNPIPGSLYQPTSDEDTERFAQILRDAGVPATVRLRRGIEINAGCGQLRRAVKAQ